MEKTNIFSNKLFLKEKFTYEIKRNETFYFDMSILIRLFIFIGFLKFVDEFSSKR